MNWILNKKAAELKAQAMGKVEEAGKILNAANSENREVTAEEREKFDALHAEAAKIGEEIERNSKQASAEQCFAAKMDLPKTAKQRYSVLKAINETMSGKGLTGIEKECNDEIAKQSGKDAQGFWMPTSIERNDAVILDKTAGAAVVQTTVDTANFVELLRSKTVLTQMGVRWVGGLVGDVAFPRQTAAGTAYWVTDGNSPTVSKQTLDQVSFSPSTVGAYTDLSRKLLKQSSIDAEAFVRDDLARILALEIERAAINGSGEGAEPEGLMQNSSVTSVTIGASGGVPTFAKVVELESTVAAANADLGALAYLTSPAGRGVLKTTAKATNYPAYLWEGNQVNGYNAYATSLVPANLTKGAYGTGLTALLFGNWGDLVIAQWGAIDIMVDPYTGSTSGTVRIVALQDLDIKPRHAASFAKIVDMATS